jgi:hypothetical protein
MEGVGEMDIKELIKRFRSNDPLQNDGFTKSFAIAADALEEAEITPDLLRGSIKEIEKRFEAEKSRLDAIASGFSVWQTVNLSTNEEQWYCQYSIDGIAVGATMREAIDKALEFSNKLIPVEFVKQCEVKEWKK